MNPPQRPAWLLNENIPAPSVSRLRDTGWDVLAIAESHASIDGTSVLALACRERRWLATFDRDYGELIFRRRLPPPPVTLLLRVPSYRPAEPAAWIEQLYATGQLQPGCFHIFDGDTMRRRPYRPGGTQ